MSGMMENDDVQHYASCMHVRAEFRSPTYIIDLCASVYASMCPVHEKKN